ncbi:MAG: transposase [Hydrogenibacillus schlegelii]|uniref:Transposase n=1 Tax=Hydrogenibacillus schlegelii TaxID=1484 RepID=A0A947CYL2_HYDSH|nr:transposase [Hydrogenibacillus schlegelii]
MAHEQITGDAQRLHPLFLRGAKDDALAKLTGSSRKSGWPVMLGDGESETRRGEFYSWLKSRGLHGVDVVVSDDHRGRVHAVRRHVQGATWQRCQMPFGRNLLDATPKTLEEEVHGRVRTMLEASDLIVP